MEGKKEGDFGKLPLDLQRYLFSFLTCEELGCIRSSCRCLMNIIDTYSAKFVVRVQSDPDSKQSFLLEDLSSMLSKMNEESRKKISQVHFSKSYSKEIVDMLPNLKAIEWKDCNQFYIFHSAVDEGPTLKPHFPQGLTKLWMQYVNLARDVWSSIPEGLSSLLLEAVDCIQYDKDLKFLTQLRNLQKFSVRNAKHITGYFIKYLHGNLKTLHIWFSDELEDISGLSQLSRLTNLDLTNGIISDESVVKYLPRSLRKLCLYSLRLLTDKALVRLPEQLTYLEINGNFQLDCFYQHLPTTLHVLKLKSCTFEGPELVFPQNLQELQVESLNGDLVQCLKKLPTKYPVLLVVNSVESQD